MKHYRIIVIFLSVAFLLGCAAGSGQKMNSLKLGMTKQAVIEAIGAPSSSSAIKNVEYLKYGCNTVFYSDEYYVRLLDGKVEAYGKKGDFNLPY